MKMGCTEIGWGGINDFEVALNMDRCRTLVDTVCIKYWELLSQQQYWLLFKKGSGCTENKQTVALSPRENYTD
jgi:hypothetical protein